MNRNSIVILVCVLIGLGAIAFFIGMPQPDEQGGFCTADVFQCADGSYVSRVAPSCEFAACPTAQKNIQVYEPVANQSVGQPLVVVGQARVFENTFSYRVLDKEGHQIAGGFNTALASDVGKFGAFSFAIDYPYSGSEGLLEVYTQSAMDGSEIETVSIPVKFTQRADTVVKAYFDNPLAKYRDPDTGLVVEECEGVFPVYRTVPKTTAVARAAIDQLLLGPTAAEQKVGYSTAINSGVTVRSVSITNGIATVDLGPELMHQVGGSCRVAMIASQIEATLRQFGTVQSVRILVDGKPDQIQP